MISNERVSIILIMLCNVDVGIFELLFSNKHFPLLVIQIFVAFFSGRFSDI